MPRVTDMQLSSTASVTKQEILYRVLLIFVTLCGCTRCLRSPQLYELVSFYCSALRAGWLTETQFARPVEFIGPHMHTHTHTHFFISLLQIPALRELCVCVNPAVYCQKSTSKCRDSGVQFDNKA